MLEVRGLMPLSTIFQLQNVYCGGCHVSIKGSMVMSIITQWELNTQTLTLKGIKNICMDHSINIGLWLHDDNLNTYILFIYIKKRLNNI